MPQDAIHYDSHSRQLFCRGDWNLANFAALQSRLTTLSLPHAGDVTLNGEGIAKMDSAGALLVTQLQNRLKQAGAAVKKTGFPEETQKLLEMVDNKFPEHPELPETNKQNSLAVLGYTVTMQWKELQTYLAFIGKLTFELIRITPYLTRWRWNALASVLYRTGYQALPIIALLSFLIGVVLTYQMGLQLRNYGANIYIVDLLGLSVLREFGPLITAIMVAGRTGSAFTASLGMMKLNQEIDALDTLGVTPAELLLIPRILGLFIALPLLTMWADIFGVFGGMVTSSNMLKITWYDFLLRFPQAVPLRAFLIGIGKAPVFALIIASVGCFEGMRVKNSAESVGQNTTKSVVLSIFFIIVADAVFSVIFSKLKL